MNKLIIAGIIANVINQWLCALWVRKKIYEIATRRRMIKVINSESPEWWNRLDPSYPLLDQVEQRRRETENAIQ